MSNRPNSYIKTKEPIYKNRFQNIYKKIDNTKPTIMNTNPTTK